MNSSSSAIRCFFPVLCGLLGFTTGCGTVVTVDSLAKPGANTISYELRNANPALESDGVLYKKAADYVRTALSGRGMFEAPPGVEPDVVVSVEFGVGPPQNRSVTKSVPTYRNIPGRVPVSVDAYNNPVYESGGFSGVEVTGYQDTIIKTVVYEK